MKHYLATLAALALVACGGGGGGTQADPAPAPPVAQAPEQPQPVVPAAPLPRPAKATPTPYNPGCTEAPNQPTFCPLVASSEAIGVGVRANSYVVFTNNTGVNLQVDQADAYTGENAYWGEYCAYLVDELSQAITGQPLPGIGEVGCTHKEPGEDYGSLTWGGWSGLLVKPGQKLILNSHVEPANVGHTYAIKVREATTALYAWRFPQHDKVFECNGTTQATVWRSIKNETGRVMAVAGAEVYAVSGKAASPSAVDIGCFYVLDVNGNVRHQQCGLHARGSYSWPVVYVQPGESIAAQANNTCQAPALWDWMGTLLVW